MVLPTFLICGAQKAGTTALYQMLRAHPEVCMSDPKETEFFNWRYQRGWEWFSSHFDHYDGETAVGEASSRTMPTPEAPRRIAERLPDVQCVFILRDPIERAHSAFWFYVSKGILCPREGFSTFIRNEGHPLRQEIVQYGFYERHLDRFHRTFGEEQCLVLKHDDLRNRPVPTIRKLCRFIGVEFERDVLPEERANVTRHPGSQTAYGAARALWGPVEQIIASWMPAAASAMRRAGKRWFLSAGRPSVGSADRAYLSEIYASTTESLEREFGFDLPSWRFEE